MLVLAAIVWFVVDALTGKGQLTADKWKPFLTSQAWTTYLLPGLWMTLQTAFWSVVIALPIGALLGIGRLSDHAWIRVPCAIIVEFFRAIPVLILMVFAYAFTIAAFGVSNPMPAAIIGLVLYNGSVLAEVFRAGILSLPRGSDRGVAGDRDEQVADDDAGAAAAGADRDAAVDRQPARRDRQGHRARRHPHPAQRAAAVGRHGGGGSTGTCCRPT